MGAASLARLLGVAQVPDDREVTGAQPQDEKLEADDVRFSYVDGRDVLHGVDLDVGVGERIAMVGPSGAGQVDARPAARRHPPAAHRRGHRRRRRPGRAAAGRPARPRRAGHPGAPRLRRHRCARTSRWPLARARATTRSGPRSPPWTRSSGSTALPDGLDTVVGSGGRALTAAQAQQIALARLVLADPHTLVLDEATSLIDPRAARHLERSLAAVLARAHGHRDRAPAVLRPRRRPRGGGRGRRDLRVRLARRAGRGRRLVRRALGLLERPPLRLRA